MKTKIYQSNHGMTVYEISTEDGTERYAVERISITNEVTTVKTFDDKSEALIFVKNS